MEIENDLTQMEVNKRPKPTPKKEVGVSFFSELDRIIHFDATEDAKTEFEEFGTILGSAPRYRIVIDSRLNFREVLDYISNYG